MKENSSKVKKPFYKKWWFWLIIAILVIGILGGNGSDNSTENVSSNASDPEPVQTIEKETEGFPATEAQDTSEVVKSTEVLDISESTESANKPDYPASIDGIDISFSDSVNDDVTGRWRLSRIYTEKNVEDFSLDYYNHFFANDDEIHIIINYTLNTVSSIRCMAGHLFVSTYNYIDGSEASAKTLPGDSMPLTECTVDIATGEIEYLDDTDDGSN